MSLSGYVISSLLTASVLLPTGVVAQEAPTPRESRLQMEMKRSQVIVHPLPDREVVAQDVERVTAALEAVARRGAHVRDTTRLRADRPDLHYDVYSAIQARGLRRAGPR